MYFRSWSRHRLLTLAILFVSGLVSVELALQWRSHLKWGQSIFDAGVQGETRYVRDASTGLMMLRPNRTLVSANQTIRTNSLGLRSAELVSPKPAQAYRIAVIGASSVFGAYAKDNESTFSSMLEARLRRAYPGKTIEVINAGVVGLGLKEQVTVLEKVILPTQPDLVLLYSGANDFVSYCRGLQKQGPKVQPLWKPDLTSSLLSYELITKNTATLRKQFAGTLDEIDPEKIDLRPFEMHLNAFVERAKLAEVKVVLSTNARSYRRQQPLSEQVKLAETALYYNYCFSLEGLHRAHERINNMITTVAAEQAVGVVLLDDRVPGGDRFFVDASHFSKAGEQAVADVLFERIAAELASQPNVISAAKVQN